MLEHQTTAGTAKRRLSSRDLALVASFAALIAVLVLVAAGLPLLSGGRGGLAVFAGPGAGYLIGWVFGAAVIGWLVQQRLPAYPLWWGGMANVVGGIGVVYLVGIPVQAALTDTSVLVAA